MDFPGERLAIKMWESLIDRGIGGLLAPWQLKRLGRASAEIEQAKILAISQAEKMANDVKLDISTNSFSPIAIELDKQEPTIGDLSVINIAQKTEIRDSIRKEVNVAKAIMIAESELLKATDEPSENSVEQDWLHNWRENVSRVSSEELQNLWGNVLAGEVKEPGTYSMRTLEFLRGLSKDEAILISKVAKFILKGGIYWELDNFLLEKEEVSFDDLLHLEGLNILSGVSAKSLTTTFSSVRENDFFFVLLGLNNRCILLEHSDPKIQITCKVYTVTRLGMELFKIGAFQTDEDYLKALAKWFTQFGVKAHVGNVNKHTDSELQLDNLIRII